MLRIFIKLLHRIHRLSVKKSLLNYNTLRCAMVFQLVFACLIDFIRLKGTSGEFLVVRH